MSDNAILTQLVVWEARIVLEALIREDERLVSEIAISTDEDLTSDMQNDLVQLRLVLNRLKDEAVAKFGKSVLNFNKGAL